MESLEHRNLMAVLTVTNTNDSGSGSLHQALADIVAGDTITFSHAIDGQPIASNQRLVALVSVSIVGNGPTNTIIDRTVLELITPPGGTNFINISGLTLRNELNTFGALRMDPGTVVNTSDLVVTQNTGSFGAIWVQSGVTWHSARDSFTGNSSLSQTGGGAITIDSGSSVILDSATISGNNSSTGGGGGIVNRGSLTTVNTTISNNIASVGSGGGVANSGTWTSINTTISANTSRARGSGNGDGVRNDGTWNALNTLVVGNTGNKGDARATTGSTVNATGLWIGTDSSVNITGPGITNGVVPSTVFGTNTLANNGGPTQTIALSSTSVALGAGAALATLSSLAAGPGSTVNLTVSSGTYFFPGEQLNLGDNLVTVSAVSGNTVTVYGAPLSQLISLASGTPINLAYDQRGFLRSSSMSIGAYDVASTKQIPSIAVSVSGNSISATVTDPASSTAITPPLTFTYYSGNQSASSLSQLANLTPLSAQPTAPGTYTVLVSSGPISGFTSANSAPTTFTVAATVDVGVTLGASSSTFAENADSTAATALTTINVSGSTNYALSLSGTDAANFLVVGNQLQLKPGAMLDFETKPTLEVTVNVDDASVAGSPDASASFTLTVTDVLELSNLSIQNGLAQRSFVRNVDLVFDSPTGLDSLLNHIQLTKFDLNGQNGVVMSLPSTTVVGKQIKLDFGIQGIGGNRNTNAGDGYYEIAVDMDGNGTFETKKNFFRILGDVTGDGIVDAADKAQVLAAQSVPYSAESDLNGDGSINSADTSLLSRAIGRKLKAGLTS